MKQTDNTITRSGTGAAHGCAGHPWRRGPLLAPEPTGGGAGGAGGTGAGEGEGAAAASASASSSSGATPTGERMYSKAEVEGIVKDRLDRAGRAKSGRQESQESNAPPNASMADSGSSSASSPLWVFECQDAIDAATEEFGVKPSAGLKTRMREDFASKRPNDPTAWVKKWFEDAGLAKAPTTTTTTTTTNTTLPATSAATAQQGPVAAPPLSSKGTATGGARDLDTISNPNELTRADYDRLVTKYGVAEADKKVADMSLNWLKRVRLRVPRRH